MGGTALRHEVRPGTYADSIVLMQLQSALAALPGVADAAVVMGTPANLDLLRAAGLFVADLTAAKPDDLIVVVRGESEASAEAALGRVDELMARPAAADGQAFRPRSLASAAKLMPSADWVLVSVPGRHAAAVAREALELRRHVFLYSDNISVREEQELKRYAAGRGLLVMGPDCGTSIIGGIGLGFANRVSRGEVGIVAASGTGLQAVASRVHALGGGVSHAIGTGGRDLDVTIGGVTTRQALDLLARDPATRVIVLVSKPPSPEVATRVLASAQATGKPVVVYFLGYAATPAHGQGLCFTSSSSRAAALALKLAASGEATAGTAGAQTPPPAPDVMRRFLRGLFAGGTLAYEAQIGLRPTLAPLFSNAPILEVEKLADPGVSHGHTILDLGADDLTVGRPHPMLDQELRLRRLRQEAADPEVRALLLDVVLGDGAHPDPAAELAPAIAEVIGRARGLEVVTVVIGTDLDPQDIAAQCSRLREAGARVYRDLDEAVAYLRRRLAAPAEALPAPVDRRVLERPPAAINVGLEAFYASLVEQGAKAVQVDWRPPAGGDERMQELLRKMRG